MTRAARNMTTSRIKARPCDTAGVIPCGTRFVAFARAGFFRAMKKTASQAAARRPSGKTLAVSSQWNGRSPRPYLRLRGGLLEAAGFPIGARVAVTLAPHGAGLIITPA